MGRRIPIMTVFAASFASLVLGLSTAGARSSAPSSHCLKFSGTVVLTYGNPDTIILHIIKGKVNAATTFTMMEATTYVRNGQSATFSALKIGDTGSITATEQLPSGILLACSVAMTGS